MYNKINIAEFGSFVKSGLKILLNKIKGGSYMSKKLLKSLVAVAAMVCVLSVGMVASAAESYTVQPGDYLVKISRLFYGNGNQWRLIYETNQELIRNPNLIYPGQVFVIPDLPAEAVEAPAADAAAPEATPEAAPAPQPAPGPSPYLNMDET